MNLKHYKEQAKIIGATALSFIPIYNVGKYFYNLHKMRVAYSNNQELLDKINSATSSMPHSQAEFDKFLKEGDQETVSLFNKCYSEAVERNTLSQKLLDKLGLENTDQVMDKMDGYYLQGNKEEFNKLYQMCQDDYFDQAASDASAQYIDYYADFDVGSMDLNLIDAIAAMDTTQTLIMIGSGVIGIYLLDYLYGKTLGAKRKILKDARKVKKQQEKSRKNVEKKKFKAHISDAKEYSSGNVVDKRLTVKDEIVISGGRSRDSEIRFIKDENSLNIMENPTKDDKIKDNEEGLIIF